MIGCDLGIQRTLILTILVFGICSGAGCKTPDDLPAPYDELEWIPATDSRLEIEGLPFFEDNDGKFWRLPESAREKVPEGVWTWARCPSGGRIRFRTNSGHLAIRLNYPTPPTSGSNMHMYGRGGVDCYINGLFLDCRVSSQDALLGMYGYSLNQEEVDVAFYLPLYTECENVEVGIDPDSSVEPVSSYALDKPIVFYGTSITQGGCVSHPGVTYPAMTARNLNVDFVNFGFDGSGRGEVAVAEQLARVDAACYVLHYAQNSTPTPKNPPDGTSLKEVYIPFINALRKAHPETPIVCVTPVYNAFDFKYGNTSYEPSREVIREAVRMLQAKGDKNLHLVEGLTLFGPEQADGLGEGLHPNTLGAYFVSQGLSKALGAILGLK